MNPARTLSTILRQCSQNATNRQANSLLEGGSVTLRCHNVHPKSSFYSSWIRNTFRLPLNRISGRGPSDNGINGSNSGGGRKKGRGVGETTILLQEGHDIQEVPVAVLRSDPGKEDALNGKKSDLKSYVDLDPNEEAAYVDGFKSYNTPQEVLKILDIMPSQEVTPYVSLSILRKLFELENNFGYRNDGKSWVISTEHSQIETFARTAIVSRLIETIISSEHPSILLDGLDVLRCERRNQIEVFDHTRSTYWEKSSNEELWNYRNKLFEEVLVRVTEGRLSLEECCRAVVSLGKMEVERGFKFSSDLIDKLWVGIMEKNADINSSNMIDVFRTIPHFNKSRRLVMNLVERKILSTWWRMDAKIVAEICAVILMDDNTTSTATTDMNKVSKNPLGISNRILLILAKCTSINIHLAKEDEILKIVKVFHALNFYHPTVEKVLSKYMKAKCLKITDPQLVAVIMDYAKKFRLRCPHILQGAAEYMIVHNGNNLSPPVFNSILSPFGYLDYQPPNGYKFWEIAERILDEKFIQFPPKDIVDLLLSCVYISKFPLNFIDRVFSPYFLDRLHTSESDYNVLQQVRSRLKLLDTTLTLECGSKYRGPLLPRDFTARQLFIDGRILRMRSFLETPLHDIYHDRFSVESSVVLPNLPLNELYVVDFVLGPKGTELASLLKTRLPFRASIGSTRINVGSDDDNVDTKDLVTVLINIPEHFSSDGRNLIGPQAMRVRHLKAIGFSVVNLKYESLAELRVHPQALNDYLRERLTLGGVPEV